MKRQKSKIFILLLFCLLFFGVASKTLAVNYLPLVPCGLSAEAEAELKSQGGDPNWSYSRSCTRCDLFRLAKNVIDLVLYGIVPPLAAVLFILGGFVILFGGARPEMISLGKRIFWNTFIGLVIIFGAWMITNTFIKSFGPDQVKSSWFKFVCKEAEISGPAGPDNICFRPAELAQQYNTAYPERNAPELDALLMCIKSKLPGENLGEISTLEKSNLLCNFTRGRDICGSCAHAVNSCHYGGAAGQGAMAVDFGNEKIGDRIIQAARECGGKSPRCENSAGKAVPCSEANHVHVNSPSCSD